MKQTISKRQLRHKIKSNPEEAKKWLQEHMDLVNQLSPRLKKKIEKFLQASATDKDVTDLTDALDEETDDESTKDAQQEDHNK
jgi:spermidine/putrescine-binding protein